MSSYMWKNGDTLEVDLKNLEKAVNNTKTEVQNGVRSIMLQVGKSSNKGNDIPSEGFSLEEVNKNLNTNFQRILSNQDLFLESCHRLQMDESQIESEISDMLEKLIDMLEKKMASEIKDIKNVEKALKIHDNRISRNVYQINSNVISLFEKSTINNEATISQFKKFGSDLEALLKFLQNTGDTEVIKEKINQIEHMIVTISGNQKQINLGSSTIGFENENITEYIIEQIQKLSKSLTAIEYQINKTLNGDRFEMFTNKISQKQLYNYSMSNATEMVKADDLEIEEDVKQAIADIFGPNPNVVKLNDVEKNDTDENNNCEQNYRGIINVRSGIPNKCGNASENNNKTKKKRRKKKKKNFLSLIDVRGNFEPEEEEEIEESGENFESTTMDLFSEESTTETTTNINNENIINSSSEPRPNDMNTNI